MTLGTRARGRRLSRRAVMIVASFFPVASVAVSIRILPMILPVAVRPALSPVGKDGSTGGDCRRRRWPMAEVLAWMLLAGMVRMVMVWKVVVWMVELLQLLPRLLRVHVLVAPLSLLVV